MLCLVLITVNDWQLAVQESPELGGCYYFFNYCKVDLLTMSIVVSRYEYA